MNPSIRAHIFWELPQRSCQAARNDNHWCSVCTAHHFVAGIQTVWNIILPLGSSLCSVRDNHVRNAAGKKLGVSKNTVVTRRWEWLILYKSIRKEFLEWNLENNEYKLFLGNNKISYARQYFNGFSHINSIDPLLYSITAHGIDSILFLIYFFSFPYLTVKKLRHRGVRHRSYNSRLRHSDCVTAVLCSQLHCTLLSKVRKGNTNKGNEM